MDSSDLLILSEPARILLGLGRYGRALRANIGRRATRQYSSLLVQSRPDTIGDLDQVIIDRKLHDALEPEWTGDQNSDTAPERISSDPRLVGIPHVFPTCR